MKETFPQFLHYQEKERLNYKDINMLIIEMIHLRATWNMSTFRATTKRIWNIYKDKLDFKQKVILKSAILQMRIEFNLMLVRCSYFYLSKDVVLRIYQGTVAANVLEYQNRQNILKSYVSVVLFP